MVDSIKKSGRILSAIFGGNVVIQVRRRYVIGHN